MFRGFSPILRTFSVKSGRHLFPSTYSRKFSCAFEDRNQNVTQASNSGLSATFFSSCSYDPGIYGTCPGLPNTTDPKPKIQRLEENPKSLSELNELNRKQEDLLEQMKILKIDSSRIGCCI